MLDTQPRLLTCSVILLGRWGEGKRGTNTYQVVELNGLTHTALELGHELLTLLQAHCWFWKGQMWLSKTQKSCHFQPVHPGATQSKRVATTTPNPVQHHMP